MSLRRAVAAPFAAEGSDCLGESEFVVALSLDRDWFSPDQAKRLVDVAVSEGLLEQDGDELRTTFDPTDVSIPDGFVPEESILRERSTFERVLDAIVQHGGQKQEAVAAINRLQGELGVTLEAAAVVYARQQGLDVGKFAERARGEL